MYAERLRRLHAVAARVQVGLQRAQQIRLLRGLQLAQQRDLGILRPGCPRQP